MTGTSRAMSGNTEPEACSWSATSTRSAAVSGNCSGLSTVTRFKLPVSTIGAEGGKPSAGFDCLLQPVIKARAVRQLAAATRDLLVIAAPPELGERIGG